MVDDDYGFNNLPKQGTILTFAEIIGLELPDMPCFEFKINGHMGWIQTSHLTMEKEREFVELGKTKWKYLYTTREWIPVFKYADTVDLREVLDMEFVPMEDGQEAFWSGFPKK